MNERIQELIKEATEFQKIPYGGIDGVYREAFVFNKEKFAELIVQECLAQVFHTIEDEEQDNISGSIRDRIKKHFGVK